MRVFTCLVLVVILASCAEAKKRKRPRGGNRGKGRTVPKHCDVAIVGGGIAGLYMAESLLRHKKETNVCLFEKSQRLGGRIYDHVFPQVPDVAVGLGAWRIDMANHNLRGILARLNIPYEEWKFYEDSRIETRGNYSRSDQEIKEQSFPALLQTKFKDMSWSEMHSYLFEEERVSQASKFANFENFQSHFLTPEGSKFYFDIFGYKGDITGGALGVAEYYQLLDAEFTGEEIRPKTGMSAIIRALAKSAKELGAKILAGRNFGIESISQKFGKYVLKTFGRKKITATKLVIAVPPGQLKKVDGPVVKKIQSEEEFQSVKAFPAFKAGAVYPRAWWEDLTDEDTKLYPMERFLSDSNCLGFSLPHGGRGKNGEAVLHLSYADGECGEKWGEILRTSTKEMVDKEMHRAIEYKFNMKVPEPLATIYQFWDDGAWFFQRPGSQISMRQVEDWAKRPFEDEELYIIGSAYHPYRAYSEGALVSANNALYEGWGIPIPARPVEARVYKPASKLRGLTLRAIR